MGRGLGRPLDEAGKKRPDTAARFMKDQPGGHLRQDVPAGLVLPNHQKSSEENAMIEASPRGGPPGRPEVVTLCGSMRFLPLMLGVASLETAAGAIVHVPFAVVAPARQWVGNLPSNGADDPDPAAFEKMLDELHRRKIDMADRVVVVTDESGYYGTSTRGEIAYAREHGKTVELLRVNGGGRS